jgi:undecaprenyl-diphosphatase
VVAVIASRVVTARATAAERRALAWFALAALVPFALLATWAHFAPTPAWEIDLVTALAMGNGLGADVLTTINTLGNLQNWAIFTLVVAVVVAIARGARSGLLVGAAFIVDIVASLVKLGVERGRPDTDAAHLLFGADSFGFPSGHTARVAALVGVVIWAFAPARWRLPLSLALAVILGLVMAYARISLGVHFPIDTLGGLLLGLGWFALIVAALG